MKLLNAFSIQMIAHRDSDAGFEVKFSPISETLVKSLLGTGPEERYVGKCKIESFIGHADTAAVLSNILGVEVKFNRQNISLERGDTVLVAQYVGGRLPEGATELPEGARIKWFLVTIK